MAQLIGFEPKSLTAALDSKKGRLTVTAIGTIQSRILSADFTRVAEFTGGRKLRIEGTIGGGVTNINPTKPFEKTWVDDKVAVPTKFKSVIVVYNNLKTGLETTTEVPIDVDAPITDPNPAATKLPTPGTIGSIIPLKPQAFPPPSSPQWNLDTPKGAISMSPIERDLPDDQWIRVTMELSDSAKFSYTLEGKGAARGLSVWRTGVLAGVAGVNVGLSASPFMYWDLMWTAGGAGKTATFLVTNTVKSVGKQEAAETVAVQYALTWRPAGWTPDS